MVARPRVKELSDPLERVAKPDYPAHDLALGVQLSVVVGLELRKLLLLFLLEALDLLVSMQVQLQLLCLRLDPAFLLQRPEPLDRLLVLAVVCELVVDSVVSLLVVLVLVPAIGGFDFQVERDHPLVGGTEKSYAIELVAVS